MTALHDNGYVAVDFFRYAEACGVKFVVTPCVLPPLEIEEAVLEVVEEV